MKFSLFLFDFDGLLVNTEELHFAAYQEMCRRRGFSLPWTLLEFFEAAHFSSTGLAKAIYQEFPQLLDKEPNWQVLYEEKKSIYQSLIQSEKLQLMPGAEEILLWLQEKNLRRCVVTNSFQKQVDAICEKLPVLKTIPLWITREKYTQAKPDPEGYIKAIKQLGIPGDCIIGFEDSFRGLTALIGAGVDLPVLVSPPDHPQMKLSFSKEVVIVPSLEVWVRDFHQK